MHNNSATCTSQRICDGLNSAFSCDTAKINTSEFTIFIVILLALLDSVC